jgi:hypothetical protein
MTPDPVSSIPSPRPPIRPRNPALSFDAADIPRHWFGGNVVATHMANGVNLLFPLGERFFVRSVRHYLDRIADDPELLAQVKGFSGQEGRHAHAHEEFFDVLRAQGFDLDAFMASYEKWAYDFMERITSPELRLSATVALEHYTAIMAENALRERLLDQAHPTMRALLLWHSSEEIEHKSVAFDVLKRVNPSYALRMSGLAFATVGLVGCWAAATAMLLRQDGMEPRAALAQLRENQRQHPVAKRVFLRGIREYLRPDFHPTDNDNAGLAMEYLATAGLT